MKNCPACKMTVDDESECPFCQTTLTYEPTVESDKEKLKFNKYLLFYLLKHGWYSLACLITVIVRLIVTKPKIDTYFFLILFFTVCSIMISLFERKLAKYAQWKYSEKYSAYVVYTTKLLFGLIAVIFSFIMW